MHNKIMLLVTWVKIFRINPTIEETFLRAELGKINSLINLRANYSRSFSKLSDHFNFR